jgi:hypothetical protein
MRENNTLFIWDFGWDQKEYSLNRGFTVYLCQWKDNMLQMYNTFTPGYISYTDIL